MSESTVLLTGRLESWVEDAFGRKILWGYIYDDAEGRFKDGELVHTSSIPGYDDIELKEGTIISTLNSTYVLGQSLADKAFKEHARGEKSI